MIPKEIISIITKGSGEPVLVRKVMEGAKLVVLESSGQEFLYDIGEKKLLSESGDLLEWGDKESKGSFIELPKGVTVTSPDGKRNIYRSDGTLAKTKEGLPFHYIIQGIPKDARQYYYRLDGASLTIGDGEDMEYTYPGSFDENVRVDAYCGKVYYIDAQKSPESNNFVYAGDQLLMSGMDMSLAYSKEYNATIFIKEATDRIFVDEKRNYYKARRADDDPLLLDKRFNIVLHGEAVSVLDSDGRSVLEIPH